MNAVQENNIRIRNVQSFKCEGKRKTFQLTTSMLLSGYSCGWVPFKGSCPVPSVDGVRMVRGGIQIHSFGNCRDNLEYHSKVIKGPYIYDLIKL